MIQSAQDDDGCPAGEPSRETRARRMFVACVRNERFGEQDIMVRNISPRGIGARTRSHPLKLGEQITVSLEGETLDAVVRWVRGDSFGALLSREIGPSRFTFGHKSWAKTNQPHPHGHVYDQFRPVTNHRRPGLKVR